MRALTGGYHTAFLAGALFAARAAVLSAGLLRSGTGAALDVHEDAANDRRATLAEASCEGTPL
jgi:hypothetical protein